MQAQNNKRIRPEQDKLPAPMELKKQLRILAALDVILCETDWLRVHSFHPEWEEGVHLGKIDNGAGDDLYVIFAPEGTMIKGFDHESPYSPHAQEEYETWPGIYEGVPPKLMAYLEDREDEFEKEDVTFCWWNDSGEWKTGETERPENWDDGFNFLFGYVNQSAESYREWAETYFDAQLELEAIQQVFAGVPITVEIIASLNPERDASAAMDELRMLGF